MERSTNDNMECNPYCGGRNGVGCHKHLGGDDNHTDLLAPNGVRETENVSRVSGEPIRVINKPLFDGERVSYVPHINAYLVAAPDAFVESRAKPLCDVPPMTYGNKPSDDGNLILSESEREAILSETPALAPFVGATSARATSSRATKSATASGSRTHRPRSTTAAAR